MTRKDIQQELQAAIDRVAGRVAMFNHVQRDKAMQAVMREVKELAKQRASKRTELEEWKLGKIRNRMRGEAGL